ncbi:site-specific integrase [Pedobacter polysacchareus]|uniref:site-specific integrase n=1 Tax=Pedobacter polysacchareus TaxID=2861973 RepID=UPI001C993AB5|nr:site-specific integrase [Pedobacter polysacchareus]
MKNNFSLRFYLKKPKNYVSGSMPIYMRITVSGMPKELASGKQCDPAKWNTKVGRVNGAKQEDRSINTYLNTLERRVGEAHTDLVNADKKITAESIKNKYLGIEEQERQLIDVFKTHNERIEALLGKGFEKGTLTKYNSTLKHLKSFLQSKYNTIDIPVSKIDHYFISEFDFHVRTIGKCANNATVKHLKNLGKVMRICLANRWITQNPFLNHKNAIEKVTRVILTPEEIQDLYKKKFAIDRLAFVRDIFLFGCYTGLCFIDLQKLNKSEIRTGIDGLLWIFRNRVKTNIATNIPLLPIAQEIMERYADHPKCGDTGNVFPIFSNQKMNAYLKEVADLCGISKHLTFHIARHTFATTVTLSNGVPIESVSKMLGHTDIRTTQVYAKILDVKVSKDMLSLKQKYRINN